MNFASRLLVLGSVAVFLQISTIAGPQVETTSGSTLPQATLETSQSPAFTPPSPEDIFRLTHSDLRDELLRMAQIDQAARRASTWRGNDRSPGGSNNTALLDLEEVDRSNTERLTRIVDDFGWPTRWMVGLDGTRAAWLLVQHADHNLAFQIKSLELMEAHKSDGQVHPADIAYLTDRVLVNQGKPQKYGTQFHVVDGRRQPRPIRNPGTVDERRASMGLSTLQEYAEFMDT